MSEISDEQINEIIKIVDEESRGYDSYEYGVPLWNEDVMSSIRSQIKEILTKTNDNRT